MTRTLIAAQSGWGKSYLAQQDTETNLSNVDYLVVLDYKDEYRGLVKTGFCQWAAITDAELGLSRSSLSEFIEDNPQIVVSRAVNPEQWREFCAEVAAVVQTLPGTALVMIDESHFVAPQREGYPRPIRELATTGRGNGVSSTWITQRPQELDETPIAQSEARFLGGFTSDRDLSKIAGVVPYNIEVHNPTISSIDGEFERPVSREKDADGTLTGSEWIYSTSDGTVTRVDTADLEMEAQHYGGRDVDLDRPV